MTHTHKLDQDSILFVKHAFRYNRFDRTYKIKDFKEPSHRILFILSKICDTYFFENMPKTFTITTRNSVLHFNLDMLKETSPVISKFIQDNPNDNNYNINITDDSNILSKIEQLYQGKNVIFKDDELPLIQHFTNILQIKNCPNELKPKSLSTNEIDSEGHALQNRFYSIGERLHEHNIEIYQKWFIKFLTRDENKVFKIITNKKEYKCNIFSVYTSNIIRQILEKDPTQKEFVYNFDDKNDEFQLISDFFNYKQIQITQINIVPLKSIAEDLQITCILKAIDNYNDHCKQHNQIIEKHQNLIDSIEKLFDFLYNIKNYGTEKVKDFIVQSKWSKTEEDVEELAAFILQVIKPSFSLQKEMAELLIQLNNEANKDNKLNILIPFIVERLIALYWPQKNLNLLNDDKTKIKNDIINLNNKCVYSFIRILYKKGIISKEEIFKRLEKYNLNNNVVNAFFLPELVEIDPKNFYIITNSDKRLNRNYFPSTKGVYSKGLCFYLPLFAKKYFPDKIGLYEKMLDNMEPDDELTKSLRHDDVDKLQLIINNDGIDINKGKVPYNIFDDFEIDQSLINYSALYGSVKCFKYLMLNGGEIDETTFYFAIYGGNNEIIKIVDQKCPKEEIKEEIEDCDTSFIKPRDSIRYDNFESAREYYSFWFYLKRYKYNLKPNFLTFGINMTFIYDKYLDENIQYQTYAKDKTVRFLNCCNINNKIAPTIAMHNNEIFDWTFENIFVNKCRYGKELENIAALSASNGNVHSLLTLIDNGFIITKDIISCSAKNGFYSLTRLLRDLYDKKTIEDSSNMISYNTFTHKSIVDFGSLSIFKLFIDESNQFYLTKAILRAITKNCINIIKYVFDNIDNFYFIQFNTDFLNSALKRSLKIMTNELFIFLLDQFTKLNPSLITHSLLENLLNQACLDSNLDATKTITELIDKENPKYDFTEAFFNACLSKSNDICRYFIDKKVSIDFVNNSRISELGIVDIDIFEKIVNNVDPKLKFLFNECINESISNKNIQVIEFILQNYRPCKSELILAVESDDLEVVELILKYNSSASFINQKTKYGTALCIAIQNKNIDIVKRLLSIREINPNLTDTNNQNALILAVQNYDIDIIDAILNFYGDDMKSYVDLMNVTVSYLPLFDDMINISDCVWEIIKRFSMVKYFNVNYNCIDQIPILIFACSNNKIDFVEFLLSLENINTNVYDSRTYNTPLMICLEKKHLDLAKLLINHPKTDINLRNCENETALVISVKNEQKEIIEILIKDKRFDPNESLLNYAFVYSNNEISKQLYELSSLDVNESFYISTKKEEINALYHATEINDIDKIDMIINHPSFNIYKSKINKCIFKAAKNNNVEVFEKLISLIDNNINIVNEKRENLLTYASMNLSGNIIDSIFKNQHFDPKNEQIINAFVQSYSYQKPIKNPKTKQPILPKASYIYTPIHKMKQEILNKEQIPAKSSLIEIMEKILNYDKEHEQLIKFGELLPNGKSFFTSISSNFSDINEVIEFLHSQGVDVNQADKEGIYPLEHAIKMNSIDMVRFFVNTESIDYSQLNNGFTYLHLAAENKESTILSFLLQLNKIDINSVDEKGETPLFKACKSNCIDNINLLFKNDNLDYLHRNKNGKDALDTVISLPPTEIDAIKQDRDKYYNKLVSAIDEKINSNDE